MGKEGKVRDSFHIPIVAIALSREVRIIKSPHLCIYGYAFAGEYMGVFIYR